MNLSKILDTEHIEDGLMNWLRGGKPSKDLTHKFGAWVQSHIRAQGGSLTKMAKTYLCAKVVLPDSVTLGGVTLNLRKIKQEDDNTIIIFFAPEGSYKAAETQSEDTLSK